VQHSLIVQLALALGLGFLVGLERQRSGDPIAGVRTFPLIVVMGLMATVVSGAADTALVASGLLAVVALVVCANMIQKGGDRPPDPGITTEVAALVSYLVGVGLGAGATTLAVVTGGAMALLLYWRKPFHEMIASMDPDELRALMRLALIGLVILPLLPDQGYGPYEVMNPFKTWLMVVLIVGISLAAYLAQQVLGTHAGVVLAGILGGLISSTATTASYARRSSEHPDTSRAAGLVLLLASTVVMARVTVEVAAVAPSRLAELAPPILAVGLWMTLLSIATFWFDSGNFEAEEDSEVPSPFGVAVGFGLLYVVVLFASAAAQKYMGSQGVYGVALVSGLTDVDAITLSAAQMLERGLIDADTAWRVILVGTLSNLAFKLATGWMLGAPALARRLVVLFGLSGAGGLLVLAFW
jgi:uncharacterized membrane protein (DUF4010 family)